MKRLALGVLLSAACAGPRASRSPTGGTPWMEIRTAHYTLQTDLSPPEARDTALYLERARSALLAAGWSHARGLEGNIKAFVFRDEVEFRRLFDDWGGMFVRTPRSAFVLFYGTPSNPSWFSRPKQATLLHELTHHLSRYFLVQQPLWLSEGIASYLETLE